MTKNVTYLNLTLHRRHEYCQPYWQTVFQVRVFCELAAFATRLVVPVSALLVTLVLKAGVCLPCDTIELTATICNFSLCRRVEKVCVDWQLLRYS